MVWARKWRDVVKAHEARRCVGASFERPSNLVIPRCVSTAAAKKKCSRPLRLCPAPLDGRYLVNPSRVQTPSRKLAETRAPAHTTPRSMDTFSSTAAPASS